MSIAASIVKPITDPVSLGLRHALGGAPPLVGGTLIQYLNEQPTPSGVYQDKRPGIGTRRAMQPGRAYELDGTGDYVSGLGSVSDFSFIQNTGVYSIAFWMTVDSITTRKGIAGNNSATGSDKGFFLIHEYNVGFGDSTVRISITNGAGGVPGTLTDARAPDNSISDTGWHHVVVRCNGDYDDVDFFIDGAAVATTYGDSDATSSTGDSDHTLSIGRIEDFTSLYHDGKVSDWRIYDDVLTDDEITYIYTGGTSGDDPGVANLQGHWKFDDTHDTIAYDSSGNGRHGTKASWVPATNHHEGNDVPHSFQNNVGYTPYIVGSYGNILDTTTSGSANRQFYIEADVIVPPSDANYYLICGKDADGSFSENQRQYFLRFQNAKLHFYYYTTLTPGGWRGIEIDSALTPGASHTVKMQYDGTIADGDDRVSFYVDGDVVPSSVISTSGTINSVNTYIQNGTAPFAVNTFANTAEDDYIDTQTGKGYYSSVKVYNEALATTVFEASAATDWVDTVANLSPTVYESDYLPRDESDTASNVRGGALTYSGKAPTDASLTQSYSGTFDGTDDRVNIADTTDINLTTSFSVAFWLYANDAPNGNERVAQRSTSSWSCYRFSANGGVGFGSDLGFIESSTDTNDSTWHHYVCTCDSTGTALSNLKIYVDGVEDTARVETAGTFAGFVSSTADMNLGCDEDDTLNWFDGSLCDFRVYSKELSLAEIKYLYDGSGTDPGTATLEGHWPLSEGAGTVAHDASGNGNHGTCNGITDPNFWTDTLQDVYHHNTAKGFSWRMNKLYASSTGSGWVKDGAGSTLTDGISDPLGTSFAMRHKPSNTTASQHRRVYRTSGDATAVGDYLIAYFKPYGSTVDSFAFQWSGGGSGYYSITRDVGGASGDTFISAEAIGNGWYKGIWEIAYVATIFQMQGLIDTGGAMSSTSTWTPLNTDDGMDIFAGVVSDYTTQDIYPTTAGGVGIRRIPAQADTLADAKGMTLRNPAGKWHNGAESLIDFTGGVSFPVGDLTWQTDWAFHETRFNPFFNREVLDSNDAVTKADRFLAYSSELSAGSSDLLSVHSFVKSSVWNNDNFNRADGAVGSAWADNGVTGWSVGTNAITPDATLLAPLVYQTALTSTRQRVRITCTSFDASQAVGCIVHAKADTTQYYLYIITNSTSICHRAYYWNGSTFTQVGGNTSGTVPTPPFEMMLEVEGNILYCYENDVLKKTVDMNGTVDYTANLFTGLYGAHTGTGVDNFESGDF